MDNIIANRYLLIEHIGQGGMADVYVALDKLLNREVAVKILRGELANDPVALLRFQREAKASCALIHPNIVEIYDVGEDNGKHYIVMEHIKGKTLKQLITMRGGVTINESVSIMLQLVSATNEAHQKNIIHRDIKPQNILIKPDGTLKMVDFGIALAHDSLQLTQNDNVMGSVHYLAPELSRGESASFQSDIYSLGIIFYELLTGKVPFKADTPVQVALMHMRQPLPSVKEVLEKCPQSIENIVIKACAKNKEFRYKTCAEMYHDLTTCLNEDRINEPKLVFDENINDEATKVIGIDMKKVEKDAPVVKKVGNASSKQVRNQANKQVKNTANKKPIKRKKSKLNLFLTITLVIVVIGSMFAAVLLLLLNNGFISNPKVTTMPSCIGLTLDQCEVKLHEAQLILDRSNSKIELTKDIPQGEIFDMQYTEGTTLNINDSVSVSVSSGIYSVMEDFIGMNIEEAKKIISEKYPNIRIITLPTTSDQPSGTILKQELLEPQTQFDANKSNDIRFTISEYKTVTIGHDIIGMNIDEAVEKLESQGIQVVISQLEIEAGVDEETIQRNIVVDCDPKAGTSYTLDSGDYVTLYYY